MVMLGVPPDAMKHTLLISRAKPDIFEPDDQAKINKAIFKFMPMKGVGLVGAGYAAWMTPPLSISIPAIIPQAAIFLFIYRSMSVPISLKFEDIARVISEKYDLANHPELLRTPGPALKPPSEPPTDQPPSSGPSSTPPGPPDQKSEPK